MHPGVIECSPPKVIGNIFPESNYDNDKEKKSENNVNKVSKQ